MRKLIIISLLITALAFACGGDKGSGEGGGLSLPGQTDTSGSSATDAGSSNSDATTSPDAGTKPVEAVNCLQPGAGECDENSECGSDFTATPAFGA